MTPLVSVIITTKNRQELLKRAIDSVLNQTYKNHEIIVVDDGSTDNTPEVVREYMKEYPNISYIRNETSKGACFSRNAGIRSAKGEFVTGLDDDDEFMPERIEKLLSIYDDKWSFVFADMIVKTKTGEIVKTGEEIVRYEDQLWKNIVGNQILVKKERILSIGGFDEKLPNAQDHDMWLRLLQHYGPAKRYREPLYIQHTEHDGPRIGYNKKRLQGVLRVYRKHKANMSTQQRLYNLLSIRKIQNKPLKFRNVINLFGSPYFFEKFVYFFKQQYRALKRYLTGTD